jgi:putative lipoic acid-binding regulatory protein
MGRRGDGFEQFVRELFIELLGELASDAVSENVSQQGTYISLTVSISLSAEEQRLAIYAALHAARPRILYYL